MFDKKNAAVEWPKDVVARFVTVGNAVVSITENHETGTTVAACSGCPSSMSFGWTYVSGSHRDGTYKETKRPEKAEGKACSWAQAHAEKCRAMPRPGGSAR